MGLKTSDVTSKSESKRLRVLISAYACEPGQGSEPGVGWNISKEMAKHHDVWVLTRSNNRKVIEEELAVNPVEGLCFFYHDLPKWASWWKKGGRGVQLYYYLWQLTAIFKVRKKHAEIGFDLSHHVTFVKYWVPSCLAWLDIPFVWGPVGGGDSTPIAFLRGGGLKGCLVELARDAARMLAHFDPFVRKTAKRCSICISVTSMTGKCVKKINNSCQTSIITQVGMAEEEFSYINGIVSSPDASGGAVFLYVGNLIFLKGIHLALRAFAESKIPDSEFWLIGEGPEKERLQSLAKKLGVEKQVRFLGKLSRDAVMSKMKNFTAVIQPSLHDSGGFVPVEAMACKKPVICLNLAGPSVLVPGNAGIKVPANNVKQVVSDLSSAMVALAGDMELCSDLGRCGYEYVKNNLMWTQKALQFDTIYRSVIS